MKLYFVRHGESIANIERVFSNRGFKHPLTEKGIAQAYALAEKLATYPITKIYSSPLQRALQTAEILAEARHLPIETTSALNEWDVGIYEGTNDPVGWDLHHQVQQEWFIHQNYTQRMPEGESFLDIQARFVPFIQQLTGMDHQSIILVGHGGLYHAMLPVILKNIDYTYISQHPFANTTYAIAESSDYGLICREWCNIPIA